MMVKALIVFDDLKENVRRQMGDIFEVSDERYKQIITKGGKWVERVDDETQKVDETAGQKKATTKKVNGRSKPVKGDKNA